MSREGVEAVRLWAEAFNRRDLDALADVSSPDVEFVPYLAALLETTNYRGHDGLRRYFEDADAAWEVIRGRVDQIRSVGDRYVVSGELYGKGRTSALEVRIPLTWVVELRDGMVTLVRTYQDPAEALEDVGLRE